MTRDAINIPRISTEAISLDVEAGTPVEIAHASGRQISGWLVIWSDAPVSFHVQDANADTRETLVLVPSANASVRLVLL